MATKKPNNGYSVDSVALPSGFARSIAHKGRFYDFHYSVDANLLSGSEERPGEKRKLFFYKDRRKNSELYVIDQDQKPVTGTFDIPTHIATNTIWLKDGLFHRIDGPASLWDEPDDSFEGTYFIDGESITEQQWLNYVKSRKGFEGVLARYAAYRLLHPAQSPLARMLNRIN